MKFTVNAPLFDGKKRYKAGDVIDLAEAEAAALGAKVTDVKAEKAAEKK